jgi:hypothetical protein
MIPVIITSLDNFRFSIIVDPVKEIEGVVDKVIQRRLKVCRILDVVDVAIVNEGHIRISRLS